MFSFDDLILSYFLKSLSSLENGFSQQYIFITFMPLTISLISLILLSVLPAVSTLSRPNCFPTQPAMREIICRIRLLNMSDTNFGEGQRQSEEPPPPVRRDRSCSRGVLWRWLAGGAQPRGSEGRWRPCQTCKICIANNLDGSQSCLVADLLTSFDKRFIIWPIEVLPTAELESFRAFL